MPLPTHHSSAGGSRTHKHQGLSLAALPVCVPRHQQGWRESNPRRPFWRRTAHPGAHPCLTFLCTSDLAFPCRSRQVNQAEGEGVEPSRLIAHPGSSRMPSPIGLPFRFAVSVLCHTGIGTISFNHTTELSKRQERFACCCSSLACVGRTAPAGGRFASDRIFFPSWPAGNRAHCAVFAITRPRARRGDS
jgi:hypothetical protein